MTLRIAKNATGGKGGFALRELIWLLAFGVVLALSVGYFAATASSYAKGRMFVSKGRGVWVSVISANMERAPCGIGPVWPADADAHFATGVVDKAAAYFTYLMSDGSDVARTTPDDERRIVADLTPDSLGIAPMKAARFGDAVLPSNIPWGVVRVGEETPRWVPFLISRNFDSPCRLRQPPPKGRPLPLDAEFPILGAKLAVWITRGGGASWVRRRHFTEAALMDESLDGAPPALAPTGVVAATAYEYWPR